MLCWHYSFDCWANDAFICGRILERFWLALDCVSMFNGHMIIGQRSFDAYKWHPSFCTSFPGIYGWVFFPSGWRSTDAGTSSNNGTEITNNSLESIRNAVGGYSYFALAMFLIMQFCVSIGVSSVPYQLLFEVFPFKWVRYFKKFELKKYKN